MIFFNLILIYFLKRAYNEQKITNKRQKSILDKMGYFRKKYYIIYYL